MQTGYVYGIHVILNLLRNAPERILSLQLLEGRTDKKLQEISSLAQKMGISVELMSKKQLDHLYKDDLTQGAVAKIRPKERLTESDLLQFIQDGKAPPLFLVLDGVQDPHNLGACLRTSDAAGVAAVIIPKDRSVGLTAVVQKIASGAAESVPLVEVTNLVRTLELLKKEGVWVMGASSNATQSIYQTDLKGSIAIVLGAEGSGLRRLTEETCDVLMQIPMQGLVESLNVSVAAGVCLYEALRQRSIKK